MNPQITNQEKIRGRGKNHKPKIHNMSARKAKKKKKIITQRHTHISATTEKNRGIDRREEGVDQPVRSSNRAVGEGKKKKKN
jgi:hypothetical protein